MKDKGLMGIGTLIIFIAIILVAAVAAAVLISTSGSLQQRALSTGGETEAGIATGVEVFSITATDGQDAAVDYWSIFLRLNPGSDPVKLNNSIFTFDTKDTFQQINYGGTETAGGTSTFNVTYLQNGTNNQQDYISDGDVLQVQFQSTNPMGERENIRIRFIPRVGTPTQVEFTTPEVMTQSRISMYP